MRKSIAARPAALQLAPMPPTKPVAPLHVLVISTLVAGCGGTSDATPEADVHRPPGPFVEVESPAGAHSRTPRFSPGARGPLLSWQREPPPGAGAADSTPPSPRVEFARLADAWTAPRTVVRRGNLFVNWADYPSVVELDEGVLAAHWLQYNGPGTYAYQVHVAFSHDEGATWSRPVVPHETVTETEHGFVTLVPDGDGVEAFWLDGRAYADGTNEMQFRHARVSPLPGGVSPPDRADMADAAGGAVLEETVLDSRACDCCQTSVVRSGAATVAVYRGRSATEIRDIEVVRRAGAGWSAPVAVHDDGWRIDACPVNGPSAAAHGDTVLVAWFTAAAEPRVLLAVSYDNGASFGEPRRLDGGGAIGRVAALGLSDGRTALAWIERGADDGADDEAAGEAGARVVVRIAGAAGIPGPPASVGGVSAARASGFPTLAEHDGGLLVAWTDSDAERVRIFRAPLNTGEPR